MKNKITTIVAFALICINSSKSQTVSTFAGSGACGATNATGTSASFCQPIGNCFDPAGNMYVADQANNKIRKITPGGVVTTFAGSGAAGAVDATGTAASFNSPYDVCSDASGNIYVADFSNHKIRKITSAGVVTTFAGSGTAGGANGTGILATFSNPSGVCTDLAGNLYVAELGNRIRKITPSGVVTTLAGSGTAGSVDATGTGASFNLPRDLCADNTGNIYVSDASNYKIRKITPAGVVTTFAGSGTAGSVDATGALASFNAPWGIAIDALGNLYIGETFNNKIRKITSSAIVTTFAGSGVAGTANGPALSSTFSSPSGVAIDATGNIFVVDYGNYKIRKITLPLAVNGAQTNLSCNGSNNGSATVTASYGNPPYTYLWSPSGGNAATAAGLSAGSYTCTITDATSTIISQTFTITQPAAINASTTLFGVTISANQNGANYQWIDCNNSNLPISGQTNQTFTASVNGSYAVIVTVGSCSVTSACANITSVGVEENNLHDQNLIYPNPTNGNIRIKNLPLGNYILTNKVGQNVMEVKVNQDEENIDLSNLQNDIYFLRGKYLNAKIIVLK
ncbi:MAG: hypothetical protein JNJ41_01065 [Bacteroidia bacterium]|nr:hypothetical protein [Bacteroidia bacterium]